MAKQILVFSMVALTFCCITFAFEPSPLQDFCDADATGSGNLSIMYKNPASVQANDFSFSGLHFAGNTANPFGSSAVTPVTVAQLPGLNTLGISMVRIDIAPWGIVPPHSPPGHLLKERLQVGFVTSNPDNTQITKVLQKGDVFVFPVGLIHFQRNVGKVVNVVAIAALSSQNPGVIPIANTVFGSKPAISSDILAKAFQVDDSVVDQLQANF